MKRKLFITNFQAPGDVLMLTAAIRDLIYHHSDKFQVNVNTTAMDIWDNNPYLDRNITRNNADKIIESVYPLIHKSNTHPYHFIHAFRKDLENQLGIQIPQGEFKVDIHLSKDEKNWYSQIYEATGRDLKYWLVVAGTKSDFTAKAWEFARFQKVIDYFKNKIVFVQIGEKGHAHPALKNVIDMRGKTNTRQLIRMMYHSSGVLCGVTFPMHLATMEVRSDRCFQTRPAVVIAGGREPTQWEMYPYHQYIHRCSTLPCCDLGGCWKSRVRKLTKGVSEEQNNSLCVLPVTSKSGQVIPKCLDMITVDDVKRAISLYDYGYNGHGKSFINNGFDLNLFLKENKQYDGTNNMDNCCQWINKIYK